VNVVQQSGKQGCWQTNSMQGRIIGNIFLKIAVSIEQVFIDQNNG